MASARWVALTALTAPASGDDCSRSTQLPQHPHRPRLSLEVHRDERAVHRLELSRRRPVKGKFREPFGCDLCCGAEKPERVTREGCRAEVPTCTRLFCATPADQNRVARHQE